MRAARVSAAALSTVFREEFQAEPHPTLAAEPVWRDATGLREAHLAAYREFGLLGWLNRKGLVAGHVLDTLSVLTRPSYEYYGMFQSRGRVHSVLVVVGPSESVLVARSGDDLSLVCLRDNESASHAFVRQLPEYPAARADSLNVRLADLGGQEDSGRLGQQDARKVRLLSEQRAVGMGELWVAARDRRGTRRTCAQPVRYLDLATGRILLTITDGYVSIAPASRELLRTRITEAMRAIRAD